MKRFGSIGRGIAIATLLCFAAPQAQAIEMYGAGTAAAQLDDGLLLQVRGGRGGGGGRHGGGVCIGGGGMHRGGVHGAECIAAEGRIAAAVSTVAAPTMAGRIAAGRPIVGARTEAARTVAGRPTEGVLIAEACIAAASTVYGGWTRPGYGWAPWRRDRCWRSAWLCERSRRRLMGWRSAGSESLLVLYRPEFAGRVSGTPASNILG